MIKLKESYGDLSDYLERHLDSWYGRLNELQSAIEDLGLDVEEINNEYVIVHAAEPDGEDVYCKIWLGGTPRTISLETFEMLESVRRSKKSISEFYRYSYDNQRISNILDKIEQTNDQRKIDKAYDFINHACDNIEDCMETGFYDLSDASWGYGTDYVIEELTDILNESVRRVSGRRLHENIDWTEDINKVLEANKDYIEKIVYTDDWDVTNWDPEIKDKVLGKIRVRRTSKDGAIWQYLGYSKWSDNILIINDKKEADSLSEIFEYIADFPVNRKKPSWKVRIFLPERFNESIKRKNWKVLKESDDKITAKSFQELISKLEDHGYSCEHYYDMKYPESNWLYITKNGDPYEAEFYKYSDGEYELYLHNIHPTKEKNEGCHRRKTKKKTRRLKEDSSERYGRYLVKISRYKNMYKLDYIDEHWDKSDYCFFDENGYLDTDYSGISQDLFDKIYDPSMKPGHVYEVYTDGPYGDIIGFEEVSYGWFRY